MALRVEVEPELLHWAIERSGVGSLALHRRFPKLTAWLEGSAKPTYKQTEAFAQATYTPLGFLFLRKPPEETVPIPDFRTLANDSSLQAHSIRPSANLLDTIYSCQQRQHWYREYLRNHGETKCAFVGSLSIESPVIKSAARISREIGFDVGQRACTWEHALREWIHLVEKAGILVMRNGIVDNNTHRKLDVGEFRGFALVDSIAPLIFINGADSKAAQMFTLVHELAHIWLGATALSNADLADMKRLGHQEAWCNQVAAEVLVPKKSLDQKLRPGENIEQALPRLAREYKVSTLVILRRLFDTSQIKENVYFELYRQEQKQFMRKQRSAGGDFYRNQSSKWSPTFARALISSAMEGQTSLRDAMRMLGVRKSSTFEELGRQLQVWN